LLEILFLAELLIVKYRYKISFLPIWRYIGYCSCSIGSDVNWRNQRKA